MANFHLSVVAPDRTVYDAPVRSMVAPAITGYMGVWANHEPQIVALQPGLVEFIDENDQRAFVATMGGFMEVSATRAIILAEHAELSTEISADRAEADLEKARRALRGEDSSMTREEAMAEINRATVRLKAARLNRN